MDHPVSVIINLYRNGIHSSYMYHHLVGKQSLFIRRSLQDLSRSNFAAELHYDNIKFEIDCTARANHQRHSLALMNHR